MKKVAFILPYYGKYPSYFDLWMRSAGENQSFDFFLISDSFPEFGFVPQNIHFIKISWKNLKERIQSLFDFKIKLREPYALCNFRPAYGEIFSDLVSGFNFWGYCDPDVIWGDLGKWITEDVLRGNDIVLTHGHCCLYRNCFNVNAFYRSERARKIFAYYSFRDVFSSAYTSHFDENNGVPGTARKAGLRVWDAYEAVADVDYTRRPLSEFGKSCAYHWRSGKVFRVFLENLDSAEEEEKMYVHLQKRPMDRGNFTVKSGEFWIFSDLFSDNFSQERMKEELCLFRSSLGREYWRPWRRIKEVFKNIRNGALLWRLRKLRFRIIESNEGYKQK